MSSHLKQKLRSTWSKVIKIYANKMFVKNVKKDLGVTDFVSEIKHLEKYPDFEKLVHRIQHGTQRFIVIKILQVSQQRQTILVMLKVEMGLLHE